MPVEIGYGGGVAGAGLPKRKPLVGQRYAGPSTLPSMTTFGIPLPSGTKPQISGPMPFKQGAWGPQGRHGIGFARSVGREPPMPMPSFPQPTGTALTLRNLNDRIENVQDDRRLAPPPPTAADRTAQDIARINSEVGVGQDYTGHDPGFGPNNPWRKAALRPYQLGSGGPGGGMEDSIYRPGSQITPQGPIAQSRFGGAMLGSIGGRANFVKPNTGGPLDEGRANELLSKYVPGRSMNQPARPNQIIGDGASPPPPPTPGRSQQDALAAYKAQRAKDPAVAEKVAQHEAYMQSKIPQRPDATQRAQAIQARAADKAMLRGIRQNGMTPQQMGQYGQAMAMQDPRYGLGMAGIDAERAMREGDRESAEKIAGIQAGVQMTPREQAIAAAIAAGEDPVNAAQGWDTATGTTGGDGPSTSFVPEWARDFATPGELIEGARMRGIPEERIDAMLKAKFGTGSTTVMPRGPMGALDDALARGGVPPWARGVGKWISGWGLSPEQKKAAGL